MKARIRALMGLLGCAALGACSASANDPAAGETAAQESHSPASTGASTGPEEDIRHFLLQEFPEAGPIRYALAWHDLDGDDADEAIISLSGPYFCGSGGCNLLILTRAGPMWRKVGDISVSRTPVAVLDTASNGWKDLTVAISGGGGPSGTVVLKFDGEGYPDNASTQPAAPQGATGTEVIPEMPDYATVEAQPAG